MGTEPVPSKSAKSIASMLWGVIQFALLLSIAYIPVALFSDAGFLVPGFLKDRIKESVDNLQSQSVDWMLLGPALLVLLFIFAINLLRTYKDSKNAGLGLRILARRAWQVLISKVMLQSISILIGSLVLIRILKSEFFSAWRFGITFFLPIISAAFMCFLSVFGIALAARKLGAKGARGALWQASTFTGFMLACVSSVAIFFSLPVQPPIDEPVRGEHKVGAQSTSQWLSNWILASSQDAYIFRANEKPIPGNWDEDDDDYTSGGIRRKRSLGTIDVSADSGFGLSRSSDEHALPFGVGAPASPMMQATMDNKGQINAPGLEFDIAIGTALSLVLTMVFLPLFVRFSALMTSFTTRAASCASLSSMNEAFFEALRLPAKKVAMKDAIPWLRNMSMSFWWLLFCYMILFLIVAMMPSGWGVAVINWLDASVIDAGFYNASLMDNAKLRIFVASLVAMMGAVPLAVTSCTFLPGAKAKQIILNKEGILLPWGPYFSTFLRPMRDWTDFKSVSCSPVKPRKNDAELSQEDRVLDPDRTLKIEFYSGGFLKLKLRQMEREGLREFLSAIDEYANNCKLADEVLQLRTVLSQGSSQTSAEGQFRSLPAKNFSSTIFVPHTAGERLADKEIRVVRQLASKPFAAVYLVRTKEGQLAIAKQVWFPPDSEQSAKLLKRFQREYELLKRLQHPRIAKVIDAFEDEQSSFMILEYCRGRDFRSIVDEDGTRKQEEVLRVAEQLCEILSYLHKLETPVLHRDLTPDNIIYNIEKEVRLIDFGAAHQFMEGITGTLVGKQCYIAPEQLRGEASTRSDIYSLGATMYYLLTGTDPQALSQCDIGEKNFHPELQKLILDLTEFEEADRPQTVDEVIDRLRAVRLSSEKGIIHNAQTIKLKQEAEAQTVSIAEKSKEAKHG